MLVPFFDLRVLDPELKNTLLGSVSKVLDHGKLILGPEVDEFEKRVAADLRVKHAVGVASGSSALYMALKAVGVGPGDEVITTPLTWIITVNAIAACGATPVCVDIGEDFNINPEAIEAALTPKTKAIVPMHYCGYVCRMDEILAIAKKHGLQVVEDAAQAYGATYGGKNAGTFGSAGIFSMNTMKVLASYGEAGVVVTNDDGIAREVRMRRYAGTTSDPKKIVTNECYFSELNHKIDTLQAAMLLVSMDRLPARMKRKAAIARRYNERLKNVVRTPILPEKDVHALYAYTIQAENRDELAAYLKENGIDSKIYHTPLTVDAPVYSGLKGRPIPVARRLVEQCLSIPAHEKLDDRQVEFVADTLVAYYQKRFRGGETAAAAGGSRS